MSWLPVARVRWPSPPWWRWAWSSLSLDRALSSPRPHPRLSLGNHGTRLEHHQRLRRADLLRPPGLLRDRRLRHRAARRQAQAHALARHAGRGGGGRARRRAHRHAHLPARRHLLRPGHPRVSADLPHRDGLPRLSGSGHPHDARAAGALHAVRRAPLLRPARPRHPRRHPRPLSTHRDVAPGLLAAGHQGERAGGGGDGRGQLPLQDDRLHAERGARRRRGRRLRPRHPLRGDAGSGLRRARDRADPHRVPGRRGGNAVGADHRRRHHDSRERDPRHHDGRPASRHSGRGLWRRPHGRHDVRPRGSLLARAEHAPRPDAPSGRRRSPRPDRGGGGCARSGGAGGRASRSSWMCAASPRRSWASRRCPT